MRFESAVIFAVALAIAGLASSRAAYAQDPRCAKMGDKIGCNCALQNGGRIEPDGRRWTYPMRSINAFAACRSGKK
jgi:hypothetical protein